MRRLWAHILIAFAALVAVFASMPTLIKGVTTNNDHIRGREFTFQLTERTATQEEPNPAKLTGSSAKEMANIMEGRLLASGIDSYKISTSGNSNFDDIVTVSFAADNDTQYTQIVTYLGFSGSFALMNNQDTVITEEEFYNGAAYLKQAEVNEYPTVILPIKNNYEKWNTFLDEALKNPITEAAQSEDEDPKSYSRIWLMYNYEKEDTYTKLNEEKKFEEKTLYYFDFNSLDELFSDDSTRSTLRYVSGYRDLNGNGYADASEVRAAYNTADYYLNLFNADALKFEVKCIRGLDEYKVWVEPQSEYIIKNDIPVKSITVDNGLEFKRLGIAAKRLGVKLYKCDPYCSFQRGTNERTNALVRRWIPKGYSLKTITQTYLDNISFEINSMPRKIFNFKNSYEMELNY